MNLRDLEYLVALAEHRHFGRAAAACFASQPTLSTQLRKLESELGVELIERGARQVFFTAAGEEVVRRARRILAEADDIRGIARQLKDPHAGTIRLGIFPTLAPYLLPHVVGPLAEHFPELEVLLVEEKSEVLLEQLRAGTLDAAVLALPVEEEGLHAEPLFREDFVLAAPAAHRLAESPKPLRSRDLAGEDLLLLTDGHCLRDQALAVCRVAGAGERSGFRATSLETLRHMVASGVGVTLLPRLAASPPVSPNPAIVLREFSDPAPHRDVALLWRPASPFRDLLPQVAAVLRALPDGVVHPLPQAG
ncbi:DNA-binding transcriptional regulator OxyR [Enemella dayhoffiae]|uniref:Probable hydrogen peroxide-inducible genes activator n=1 Tax=Enemella dayhoffiae TaxID=2016507 RepID=A0A255GTB3_9ACTN|nr:LysR substrate-binding domain-containing protein [Enemella dayhoffiae]OYO18712.1 DNA-binding transcriptional regulator OxyR [Enemella dayhoffiae]